MVVDLTIEDKDLVHYGNGIYARNLDGITFVCGDVWDIEDYETYYKENNEFYFEGYMKKDQFLKLIQEVDHA